MGRDMGLRGEGRGEGEGREGEGREGAGVYYMGWERRTR